MIFRDHLDAIRKAVEGLRPAGDPRHAPEAQRALDALDALERRLTELEKRSGSSRGRVGEPGGRSGPVILIAEDDAPARRVMVHLLDHAGYQVLEAENGASALRTALYHEGSIDLLLTDLVMPDFDGVTLAGQIRGVRPDIKVLFVSGFDTDELRRQEVKLDERSVQVIRKPFRREELLATLHRMLNG